MSSPQAQPRDVRMWTTQPQDKANGSFSVASQVPALTVIYVAEALRSRRFVVLVVWLSGCVLATIGALAVYVVAQQVGRRAADDVPRVVLGQQVAALSQGGPTTGPLPVDPATPLSSESGPFVIVYDSAHRILSTTALLDNATPGLPTGTLQDAVSRGRVGVTWQPRPGVREAIVAQPWTGPAGSGVVVAGIGLGPTEDRAHSVLVAVAMAWVLAVLALTTGFLVLRRSTG